MNNSLSKWLLVSSLTFFTIYTAYGQQMVIEQNFSIPQGLVFENHLDENNFTKLLDQNETKIFVKNSVPAQGNSLPAGEEGVDDVSLNLTAINYAENYRPHMSLVFDETGYFTYIMWEEQNTISLSIPAGIYEIVTNFKRTGGGSELSVIKELVEISENTHIEINAAEAVHKIKFDLYNEVGEVLEPGIDDDGDGTYTGGNVIGLYAYRTLHFMPTNSSIIQNFFGWGGSTSEDQEPVWNFYVSDVSERYSMLHATYGLGNNGAYYISRYQPINGISQPIVMANNPEDWVFHKQKFQVTPLGESSSEGFFTRIPVIRTWQNERLDYSTLKNTMTEINPSEGIDLFLNNRFEENLYNVLVIPGYEDYSYQPVLGSALVTGNDKEVLFGSGSTFFPNINNFYVLGGVYYGSTVLPFHQRFSFFSDGNNMTIHGDNVPISSVGVFKYSGMLTGLLNYVGRYGETRESDIYDTEVEIKRNEEVVFSGSYTAYRSYMYPQSGNFHAKFVNKNINIDGLSGKNITELTFDLDNDDFAPPTLQHLQFRTTDGLVTDRFELAQDGTARLAAGDFEFDAEASVFAYREGSTVDFFYSRYNQNEWTELELTEHPEHFQMPAFGDYYEASLESVIVPEDNTWFDVRIICTDTTGNKQEQIISPAFKVEQATMGIEEVDKSDFSVSPNPFTNEVNIQLPENVKGSYTFKVADLTGKTIYTQNQDKKSFVWNGSLLPKGIYILSIENNGKVIAQKVIKK